MRYLRFRVKRCLHAVNTLEALPRYRPGQQQIIGGKGTGVSGGACAQRTVVEDPLPRVDLSA